MGDPLGEPIGAQHRQCRSAAARAWAAWPRLSGPKATSSSTVGQKSWSSESWNRAPRGPAGDEVGLDPARVPKART